MLPIPLPWLIVGVLISLFGTYRVGHHYGWLERDNDMKIAIAKKNDESRKTEQKLTEQLNANASKLQETQNVINQKQSAPPQIQKQEVNLTDRLTKLLMPNEQPSSPLQK
jgi:hypothetical protein